MKFEYARRVLCDHRICVEFLPPRELLRPDVVRLLVAHRVAPMLAAPGSADDEAVVEALRPYIDAGLPACAWPLLVDAEGYWPSESNAERFAARVERLLAAADRRALRLPWIAVDLEPRLDEVTRARRAGPWREFLPALASQALRHLDRARFDGATAELSRLHKRVAARGTRSVAIAYPFVSADFATVGSAMQDLCEAPLRCGWDRIAIMTYGSMLSGYSHRTLSVEDVRWYGYRATARLARALGPRAGAFVGIVGNGKLGDEPTYTDENELARDAEAARAAGVGEVSIFGLEGILAQRSPERWLQAVTGARPSRPRYRLRGELLHRGIELGARAVGVVRRLA